MIFVIDAIRGLLEINEIGIDVHCPCCVCVCLCVMSARCVRLGAMILAIFASSAIQLSGWCALCCEKSVNNEKKRSWRTESAKDRHERPNSIAHTFR